MMQVMKRRHGASAQQRRVALIEATIEVAAAKGMSGVTHRAVTEQAGLPLTTVGYFFDSITELAAEALRSKVGEDVAAMHQLAAQLQQEQRTPAEMAVAFATAASATERTAGLAFVEALLHAARDPEFRAVAVEVLEAGRSAAASATTAAGIPGGDSEALLALVHGYLLHSLAAPELVRPDALLRGIRALMIGGLVEQGRVELALAITGRE